jgi:hypothetical protein
VIKPQTPTGSLIVITLFPATEAGIVSPYILGASSLNHSKKLAAYAASPFASANGFPFSQVMSFAISSACSTCLSVNLSLLGRCSLYHTIKSYHFRNNLDRSRPVLVLKEGKAAAAASMASCVSAVSNSGAVPISLPDEGSGEQDISVLCLCVIHGGAKIKSYHELQKSFPTLPPPILRSRMRH